MGEFRFKQFTVRNERSAMKVNTDGVLLGALMTVRSGDLLSLDVGTGTGTVALMAAQRMAEIGGGAHCGSEGDCGSGGEFGNEDNCGSGGGSGWSVLGIDIDEPSAEEAAENFRNSPWAKQLTAKQISLQDFAVELPGDAPGFDHIFSNPPYFDETLKAPDPRRRAARHADTLSWRDLIDFAVRALSPEGILSIILPASTQIQVCRYARMSGLFPMRIVRIRTTDRKPASRVVLEFSRHRTGVAQGYAPAAAPVPAADPGLATPSVSATASTAAAPLPEETTFTIHRDGQYSDEYVAATANFYLWLP